MIIGKKYLFSVFAFLLFAGGCQRDDANLSTVPTKPHTTITIGDIDKEDPASRAQRLRPLANYLGAQLASQGVKQGEVRISADIASMAQLMKQGQVDVYIDSPYPVLAVNKIAGGHSILLNQALNDATYQTVFIALGDSPISKLRDLLGTVVVFQAPHSTSGFLLPAAYILESGYQLRAASEPLSPVTPDHIGCTFSGDEIKTVEMILNGTATVGAISNQDLRALSQAKRDRLKVVASTYHVPRQLVAIRAGVEVELKIAVVDKLLKMTDEQRAELAAQDAPNGWTWNFAPLTPAMQELLKKIEHKFDFLPNCTTVPGTG